MKYLTAIALLISVCLTGCVRMHTENRLKDIESYIMDRPDSALAVLDTMNRDLLATKRLKAHHALLHAMALDKNYIDVSDDSLANIAVSYYSKNGPEKYKARSLYYLGLSYYYAQDYKKAILEFTKAEKVAEKSDSLYWGFTKVAQADTYAKTYNETEEYNCLNKAHIIFSEIHADHYKYATEYRLSVVLHNSGKTKECQDLLESLLSNENVNENIRLSATISLAFSQITDTSTNLSIPVNLYEKIIHEYDAKYMTSKDYWAWAYSLKKVGRDTEARDVISQLKDLDTSGAASYWMYMIRKSDGNLSEALRYLEQSTNMTDKLITKALQQSLALSQRDYYESEFRNSEYKAHNRKLVATSIVITSILIIVLVVWGSSVYIRRQREEKEYYLNYADEIRRQLEASKNDNYPELKKKYLDIYKSRFEMIGSLYEEYVLYQGKKNAEHAVYAKVSEIIKDFIDDNSNKSQLEAVLDESLDGIIAYLRKEMPKFKEVDYSIFCFITIGFDVTTISHLHNISMNAVYIRKSRMKQRIEDANPEHKERFLEVLG